MMKIVLIVKNEKMQYKIKKVIRIISIQSDKEISILNFPNWSKQLNQEINDDTYYKLYIIDFSEKENDSYLKIAQKIRKKDLESDLIFITNKSLLETIHQNIVQIFDIIDTPKDLESHLLKDIQIVMTTKIDQQMLMLKKEKKTIEIPMKKILYITRDKEDRKAIIYYTLNDQEKLLRVNYTLKELKAKLDSRFVRTHKSCIANKKRMIGRNYMKKYFVLDTGKQVELLSPKYQEEIEKETVG